MNLSRRELLQSGALSASLLATGATLPGFLTRTARAAMPESGRRVLVVVQLTGGNDGLNTVIPYRDDRYHKARPTLRIAPDRALKLDNDLGLHPDMTGFKRLYDDGLLGVLTNVGYPNPDRSHFRSMDIWHTALLDPEAARDGWLGRVVDRCAGEHDAKGVAAPVALHLDDQVLPLALQTQQSPVPSIRSIDAFRLQGDAERIERALAAPRDGTPGAAALDDLLFVQRTAVSSCANARRLERIRAADAAAPPYPGYGLATNLRQIAQLIGADFGPRIYYTSLGGFDTHARQVLAHGPLLRELAESVAAFFDDLKSRGLAERVVLLTFSEFGRRVAENGSQGTDHGAAAPMFVAGPAVRAGIHGSAPDLGKLLEGDVRHEVDFRGVYASLLDSWLEVPSDPILGGKYRGARVIAQEALSKEH